MSKKSSDSEQPRAKWTKLEGVDLLSTYFDARNDPSQANDKGIKAKAGAKLIAKLNAKNKRTLDKSQYKSNLGRLKRDYDFFKEITSLSGCSICSETGKSLLEDDVWYKLIEQKPKQKGKIQEFRKDGFEHTTVCSLIAGDTRTTGARADSITTFLSQLERSAFGDDGPVPAEVDAPRNPAATTSDDVPRNPAATTFDAEYDPATKLSCLQAIKNDLRR